MKMKDIGANITSDTIKSMIDANVFNEYIKGQNLADQSLIEFLQDTNYATKDLTNYQEYLKKSSDATSGFSDITSKTGNILKSFTATLGSMGANWFIGQVISFVAEKLYEMTHAEEIAAEKAKELHEKANTAASNITSTNDSLNSHKKTVADISLRYAELAQKVENLGYIDQNQGTLTYDDYSEFLNISNQLAEIFPSLTKSYDDNGNAILSLNGNVNTITTSLQNLIDKEKELTSQEINKNLNDLFVGTKSDIEGYNNTIHELEEQIDNINTVLKDGSMDIYLGVSMGMRHTKTVDGNYQAKLQSFKNLFDEYGIDYEQYSNELPSWYNNPANPWYDNLSEKLLGIEYFSEYLKILSDPKEVQKAFTQKIAKLNKELQTQQTLIDSSNGSIKSYVSQWANTDYSVLKLSSQDQNTFLNLLDRIDWTQMPDSWEKTKTKLYKDYLSIFSDGSEEVQEAFTKFFNGEDLTVEEYKKYKDQILQYYKDQGLQVPAELEISSLPNLCTGKTDLWKFVLFD